MPAHPEWQLLAGTGVPAVSGRAKKGKKGAENGSALRGKTVRGRAAGPCNKRSALAGTQL